MSDVEVIEKESAKLETELQSQAPIVAGDFSPASMATSPATFEHIQRVAKMYAASQFTPDHYKGKIADCAIAVSMACSLGVNPVVFLQKTYPVKGRIGFEGQLAIALVNTCGKFQHSLRFSPKGEGDNLSVIAWTLSQDGQRLEGKYSLAMARAAGLASRDVWKAIPEQKCCYMAALMFARLHCPEQLMGMSASEELEVMSIGPTRADTLNVKLGLKKD